MLDVRCNNAYIEASLICLYAQLLFHSQPKSPNSIMELNIYIK
jgi:hypothetical protein